MGRVPTHVDNVSRNFLHHPRNVFERIVEPHALYGAVRGVDECGAHVGAIGRPSQSDPLPAHGGFVVRFLKLIGGRVVA